MLGLDDFHRSHALSLTAILCFCDSMILQHPCFYLHYPGLPFWCRSMFSYWISAQNLLTDLEAVEVALQMTLLAGEKLSSQDNPILAFMTSFKNVHKYSIHLLLRGTKSFIFHVDPGKKFLFTQIRFQYVLAVLELPFTIQILFVTCITFFEGLWSNGFYTASLHKGESYILLGFPFHSLHF